MRSDNRTPEQVRPLSFQRDFTIHAAGSVLVSFGNTRLICTCCAEDGVPRHRSGKGGWLTAEYDMLPSSTNTRKMRAITKQKQDGRSIEIQRLIGRSLRAIIDLDQLEDITLYLDCDVIQADGGTRTAAISGAYVALHDACMKLKEAKRLKYWPLIDSIAAVSVGVVDGTPLCDLAYTEDVRAEVDMNVVMRGNGEFVEVQGTAEGQTFGRGALDQLLALAEGGCAEITKAQKAALGIE